MSNDAFAAALGKGAGLNCPHPMEAPRTGSIFGRHRSRRAGDRLGGRRAVLIVIGAGILIRRSMT
jgi:hypothetical protein